MEDRVRGALNDGRAAPLIGRRAALTASAALLLGGRARAFGVPESIRTMDQRDVQVTCVPSRGASRATVLFSHGALSSPWKYQPLLHVWADAGFTIYAPLHVDSTEHPDHAKYGMLQSWAARLQDMRALASRFGGGAYIAAGHSYGALVALTLGGAAAERPPGLAGPLRDPAARAAVAFSPPGPSPGLITAAGYASLAVPALIQTGTADIPFGVKGGDWRVHLAAYDAAPGPAVYGLVLPGADHYFGGLICRPELPGPRQAAQFDIACAASTLFLQAFGADDPAALPKLDRVAGLLHRQGG